MMAETWSQAQERKRLARVAAYHGPQHRSASGIRSTVEEWLDYYLNGESRNSPFLAAYIPMTKDEIVRVAALLGIPAHAEGCTYDTPCQDCIDANSRSTVRTATGRGGSILGKRDD